MGMSRCGSFGMLLSCAQGPLGWRLAQAAGGLRALREAGVDLEIAKNLAWHRAGRQCASLAEMEVRLCCKAVAPLPRAWLGEAAAACPRSSGSVWGSLVSRGGMLITPSRGFAPLGSPCSHPAWGQCQFSAGEREGAAWRVLGGVMLHPGSFWL